MIIENQKIQKKWTKQNRKWYESKNYLFTNYGESFIVDIMDLSPGVKDKVYIKCDYCGDINEVTWQDCYTRKYYIEYACKHCKMKRLSEKTLKDRQTNLYMRALESCEKLGLIFLTDKSEILNSESRVKYKCPKHGINETKIYTLILGHGCPYCKLDNQKLKPDDIQQVFEKYNVTLLNKDDYIDSVTKNLLVICQECGEIFVTSYNSFVTAKGQRCPKCSKSESKGECCIRNYLNNNNICFIQQYTFPDCKDKKVLPFDFYLPKINLIIEYDGKQHFEPTSSFGTNPEETFLYTKKHDNIKNMYCINNNINLLRIPYWDYENIETILNKEIYKRNLHEDIV